MECPLEQATALPAEINVYEIAEDACQAAFALIAARLEVKGYPVSGDFAPDEVVWIDATFQAFVRAMALNNPILQTFTYEAEAEGVHGP